MNKFFTSVVLTATTLVACNNEPEVRIMGTQHACCDSPEFVPDSVYFANQAYIDSLTTVTELLDHLETLPTE